MARDSEKHKLALEKLLKTLKLDAPSNEVFGDNFDFTSKHDIGILREIAEQDEAAKDLYTELMETTDPKLVASLSSEEVVKLFYGTLTRLVKDEERHMKMVQNLAGDVKRVQPTRL